MGLDMYLTKKTHVGFNYEHNREENGTVPLTIKGRHAHIKPERVSEIIEEIGYWRKANAIHAWFVENVQKGEDDCQDHYIEEGKLEELLRICNLVLSVADIEKGVIRNGKVGTAEGWEDILQPGEVVTNSEIVAKILPTQSGFFFGGTDYDQYYIGEVGLTKKIIEAALKENKGDLYYRSSW